MCSLLRSPSPASSYKHCLTQCPSNYSPCFKLLISFFLSFSETVLKVCLECLLLHCVTILMSWIDSKLLPFMVIWTLGKRKSHMVPNPLKRWVRIHCNAFTSLPFLWMRVGSSGYCVIFTTTLRQSWKQISCTVLKSDRKDRISAFKVRETILKAGRKIKTISFIITNFKKCKHLQIFDRSLYSERICPFQQSSWTWIPRSTIPLLNSPTLPLDIYSFSENLPSQVISAYSRNGD